MYVQSQFTKVSCVLKAYFSISLHPAEPGGAVLKYFGCLFFKNFGLRRDQEKYAIFPKWFWELFWMFIKGLYFKNFHLRRLNEEGARNFPRMVPSAILMCFESLFFKYFRFRRDQEGYVIFPQWFWELFLGVLTVYIFQKFSPPAEPQRADKINKMVLRPILSCFEGIFFFKSHLRRHKEGECNLLKMVLRAILRCFKAYFSNIFVSGGTRKVNGMYIPQNSSETHFWGVSKPYFSKMIGKTRKEYVTFP